MRRVLLAILLFTGSQRAVCRGDDRAPPRADAGPLGSSAAPISKGPFAVVDVLDLGRKEVRSFAFNSAAQELFVSFSDRWSTERGTLGDDLQQWSLSQTKLVFTYRVDPRWYVDAVTVSPDGRRAVVVAQQATSVRYMLLDTEKHAVMSRDLGPHDIIERAEFSADSRRIRIKGWSLEHGDEEHVFDTNGRPVAKAPSDFPVRPRGDVWVIESSKGTSNTHGLYFTAPDGTDHLVTQGHWHGNYGITRDRRFVVTTTWDGDLLAWDTAEKRVAFTWKIAPSYGYLAHDELNDRFLIGDAHYQGTTKLRALVRTREP